MTWSVAEGRRGRRWREVRAREGHVISSLLLEMDPEGRFSHTELATPAGLLSLHPEGDGTLHGNTISVAGVTHVVGLPWVAEGLFLVEGSTIARAAAARQLGGGIGTGRSADCAGVLVDLGLAIGALTTAVRREEAERWRFGELGEVVLDGEGLPRLAEGATWPLEE